MSAETWRAIAAVTATLFAIITGVGAWVKSLHNRVRNLEEEVRANKVKTDMTKQAVIDDRKRFERQLNDERNRFESIIRDLYKEMRRHGQSLSRIEGKLGSDHHE